MNNSDTLTHQEERKHARIKAAPLDIQEPRTLYRAYGMIATEKPLPELLNLAQEESAGLSAPRE